MLECDFRLKDMLIRGEISNFTDHYKSGHFYFTLKAGDCAIKAVMFASYAKNVPFRPKNGMAVIVRGSVSLYERDGSYQLYVYDMQPEGKGSLQLAYEQLLQKLKSEGLFDGERKRPIPRFPERVGLITSDTGAALHDMLNIITRRYPPAQLILYPALVQGKSAPASLIRALDYFNRNHSCDVIIIGRGGGSLEDLWAFNDENLVRAVAASEIPVLQEIMEDLSFLGFELTDLGGGSYAINGVPAGIEGLQPVKLVQDMLQTAIEKGCKVKEEVQSILALSLAKATAIVPGQVLSAEEMNHLVDDFLTSTSPNYTPDGKVALAVIKEDELEKLFK